MPVLSLKSHFGSVYLFTTLFFTLLFGTIKTVDAHNLENFSSSHKELSKKAKAVIKDLKSLGPGGPLLPEERSKVEEELELC